MKKLFLSLVAAIVAATATYAQSSLLATLSHEGTISTYYGASALREAHEAAANGDIITLSSGSFLSVDITKGITLRGAGWEVDEVNHNEPTVILGDFYINIPTETTERLTIEGIYYNGTIKYKGTLQNATFLKSRFNTIKNYGDGTSVMQNVTFIHCRVSNQLYLTANCSAACINCVIWNPITSNTTSSNFECVNCVLFKGEVWSSFYSSSLKSSILIATRSSSIPSSTTVFNCVGLFKTISSNYFENVPNSTNRAFGTNNSPLKTYTIGSDYDDSEKFELTDEAKTKYLGIDGTQVGLYGGTLPFSSTPSNPQITKCNVAAKSTADGKLSVDITVNGAE